MLLVTTPKTCNYWKGDKMQTSKNLAPTALPVSYKNQKNAWMDSEIFQGSFFNEFVPSVEQFLKSLNLPRKANLIIDNAPS
jgi:hypothetical protein